MVLIEVTLVRGAFTETELRRLAADLTDAVAVAGGAALRAETEVIVREVAKHRWSSGGYPLAAEDVLALKHDGREGQDDG